jgi:plastocyanin
MRKIALVVVLLLLAHAAALSRVRALESDANLARAEEVTLQVTLREGNSKSVLRDQSKVVAWLIPAEGARPVAFDDKAVTYRMIQREKRFTPDLLVVPVGTQVEFPNLDPWFHSVFSLYEGKRFDLGLYEAGSRKRVAFDRPGPSYIFCNIHPEMSAVVLAIESDYSGISNQSGRVAIENVPDGKYILHVWYANAPEQELSGLERTVEIASASRTLRPLSITVTPPRPLKHKNKYGHDYDPDVLEQLY